MKNILFITPFTPSNIGAAMKFTKKTIETLAEKYHIDLVYFRAEGEGDYLPNNPNINVLCTFDVNNKERILCVLQKPWLYPTFSARYRRKLQQLIAEKMKEMQYDLLFLDHSQSFIYGKDYPDVDKILMSHDVIYQRVSRTSNKLIASIAHSSEKQMIVQPKSHVFSFSTKDKLLIDSEYGINSHFTCGNVDDLVYETYPKQINKTYVFFGQWVRQDNSGGLEWFLKEVYDKTPSDSRFVIIGRGLSPELEALVKRKDRIEYLGFVDNPYQIIADSTAVISPLFSGAGVKFKVLESIACGTPVIGTKIAFEGIPNDYSDFMIVANSADEYINQMEAVQFSVDERIEMKTRFLREYVNPYLIKYIDELMN